MYGCAKNNNNNKKKKKKHGAVKVRGLALVADNGKDPQRYMYM